MKSQRPDYESGHFGDRLSPLSVALLAMGIIVLAMIVAAPQLSLETESVYAKF